jgi:hypothetical protein
MRQPVSLHTISHNPSAANDSEIDWNGSSFVVHVRRLLLLPGVQCGLSVAIGSGSGFGEGLATMTSGV